MLVLWLSIKRIICELKALSLSTKSHHSWIINIIIVVKGMRIWIPGNLSDKTSQKHLCQFKCLHLPIMKMVDISKKVWFWYWINMQYHMMKSRKREKTFHLQMLDNVIYSDRVVWMFCKRNHDFYAKNDSREKNWANLETWTLVNHSSNTTLNYPALQQ